MYGHARRPAALFEEVQVNSTALAPALNWTGSQRIPLLLQKDALASPQSEKMGEAQQLLRLMKMSLSSDY